MKEKENKAILYCAMEYKSSCVLACECLSARACLLREKHLQQINPKERDKQRRQSETCDAMRPLKKTNFLIKVFSHEAGRGKEGGGIGQIKRGHFKYWQSVRMPEADASSIGIRGEGSSTSSKKRNQITPLSPRDEIAHLFFL